MEKNPNLKPNSEANQLPEADSLPDGFVDSSSLEPSSPKSEEVTNYKDEKLVEPGSSSEAVISNNSGSVKFSENVGDQAAVLEEVAAVEGSSGEKHAEEKSLVEGRDPQTVKKEPSLTGNAEKNKKVDATDVKRKNTKRNLKTDKEILEFTLKYQQVVAERDSAVAVRDKLESLCRELQRQNKMLMEECKRVSTEGQNLRLDLSTRFQDAIKDNE